MLKTNEELQKLVDATYRDIKKDLDAWLYRLAVTVEDKPDNYVNLATELLKKDELDAFHWTLEEYIKRAKSKDDKWIKAVEQASANYHITKLTEYKMLLEMQYNELIELQKYKTFKALKEVYNDRYLKTAYDMQRFTGKFSIINPADDYFIKALMNKSWLPDGKNISSRIWKNKQGTVDKLMEVIHLCGVSGKHPLQYSKDISQALGMCSKRDKYCIDRLLLTESAYVASVATLENYKDMDVEKYKILATLDSKTSDICRDLDGKIFKIEDYKVGITAPPFHPHCITTTAPYDEEWDWEGSERLARDEDGKNYYVSNGITYHEWEKAMVNGKIDDLKPIVPDDIIKSKPQTLAEKIQKVKEDIAANGGVITEDHIKSAGKAVQDDLVASRAGFKKDFDDATAAYNNSDIKKQIDELDARRRELHKKYSDAPYGSDKIKQFYNEWEQAKADYWKVYSGDEAISFRSRISDAKKKYEGTWETNANELTEKLGQFRTMGIGSHDLKKEHYSGRGTLRDIVTTAYSHYPADWVEASIKKGHLKISKVSRGFYDGRTIAIDGLSESSQISTAFHELGHRFEDVVKGIYEAEDVFYKRRTKGCPLEWLGTGYSRSERTRKDNFLHSYMGKEYPDNFYELVYMGFDWAYTDPTRLWADEDFAQFIYGILSLK